MGCRGIGCYFAVSSIPYIELPISKKPKAFLKAVSLSSSIAYSLSLKNIKNLGLLSSALAPTRGTHITHP